MIDIVWVLLSILEEKQEKIFVQAIISTTCLSYEMRFQFFARDKVFGLLSLTHAGQTLGLMPGSVSIYAGHLLDKCLVLCWRYVGNYAGIMLGVIIMRHDVGHVRFMSTLQLLHWLLSLLQVVRLSVHTCGHRGSPFTCSLPPRALWKAVAFNYPDFGWSFLRLSVLRSCFFW